MNKELLIAFAKLKKYGLDKVLWKEIAATHSSTHEKYIKEYDAYTTEKLAIQTREFDDPNKVNNKLVNAYRTEIIDQVTGYLFGNAIKYSFNEDKYNSDELLKIHSDKLESFLIMNTIDDMDAETGRLQAINGKCYRLVYTDTENNDMIKKLQASDVIYFDDEHSIWYYDEINEDGEEVTVIEYYETTTYSIYELKKVTDEWEEVKVKAPHNYDYMPIVEFLNNDMGMNDFKFVDTLVDAYDRLLSDTSSEFEQFRLAYMVFKNCSIDVDTITKAKQTGAFSLPSENGNPTDAGFIVKEIDTDFVDWLEKKLKENIYRFSKSIDMSDEKFSGTSQSGESRKYKLISLETKAGLKERKFKKALRRMFKVLFSKWNKTLGAQAMDYLDVKFTFNRKLPVDLSYAGDVLNKLSPYLSQKTLLGQLEFIDNPEQEIEQARQEQIEQATGPQFQGFNGGNDEQ